MICLKPELNVEIFDYLVVTGTVSELEVCLKDRIVASEREEIRNVPVEAEEKRCVTRTCKYLS